MANESSQRVPCPVCGLKVEAVQAGERIELAPHGDCRGSGRAMPMCDCECHDRPLMHFAPCCEFTYLRRAGKPPSP